MADNAIDIITSKVLEQFDEPLARLNEQAEAIRDRAEAVLDTLEAEGRARMDAFFIGLPSTGGTGEADGDGFDPVAWIKMQARSRALRTLLQGLVAVVITAVGNTVVQSIANPNFDFFSWDDWKLAAALAGSAVLTAAVSFVQNRLGIKPPKVGS